MKSQGDYCESVMTGKILFVLAFALLMMFPAVAAAPVQGTITWPDWNGATAYPDPTGDANNPHEDMTVCYVTHDDNYLYLRVEYAGSDPSLRALLIYLDVDQSSSTGKTGTDSWGYTLNLHDIGADYRIISSATAQPSFWLWNGTAWEKPFADWYVQRGTTYINVMISLESLGSPEFPIDILFVTFTEPPTDYNPNSNHITYPRQPAVGGEVSSVNSLALLAPWIALAVATLAVGLTLSRRKFFLH